jgi:hypothetical protein
MRMISVVALAVGTMYAQSGPATTSAQSNAKSKKTAKPAAPVTIPASAVDQGDGSFRYVDPKGTAWIYRKTPFGISRATEASLLGHTAGETPFGTAKGQAGPVAAPAAPKPGSADDPDSKVTAVEKGDMIEFTRPTPFGVTKWQKNKNDLNASEKKIWDRLQPKGNQ